MNNKVTLDILSEIISEKIDLEPNETREMLDFLVDEIILALKEGQEIQLRGLGTLGIKKREGKWARNIRAKKKVFVPEHYAPFFRPGVFLKTQLKKSK